MKKYNQVEVILVSNYSINHMSRKEHVRWLGTVAQSAISRQQDEVKKIFSKILKDSPAIYLS